MNRCSSSNSALVRGREETGVPTSIEAPRKVVGNGRGRAVAARRERRPVVQIDDGEAAGGTDNRIAAENIEADDRRRMSGQAGQRRRLERVPRVGGARVEPVKELSA